jgi:hypothetical protein
MSWRWWERYFFQDTYHSANRQSDFAAFTCTQLDTDKDSDIRSELSGHWCSICSSDYRANRGSYRLTDSDTNTLAVAWTNHKADTCANVCARLHGDWCPEQIAHRQSLTLTNTCPFACTYKTTFKDSHSRSQQDTYRDPDIQSRGWPMGCSAIRRADTCSYIDPNSQAKCNTVEGAIACTEQEPD